MPITKPQRKHIAVIFEKKPFKAKQDTLLSNFKYSET
jgi:hypothetical protein